VFFDIYCITKSNTIIRNFTGYTTACVLGTMGTSATSTPVLSLLAPITEFLNTPLTVVFSARRSTALLLTAVLSVSLSVRHTRQQYDSRHQDAFCTTRYRAMFQVSVKPNFMVVNLGFHPERVC